MNVSNPPHQWDEEAQETVVGNAQTLQFLQQKSVEEIAFVQQRLVNHETSQSDAIIPLLERLLRFNIFRRDGVCVASMGKGGGGGKRPQSRQMIGKGVVRKGKRIDDKNQYLLFT